MADALFIRPDDTRLLSYVEQNYDNDQLSALIYDTQQLDILPLIGTGLYNELDTQIVANTLTAANTTLLTHLRSVLRMSILARGMIVFNYKIRNKGVQTMSSDNAQSIDLTVLDRMVQEFKDSAQIYSSRTAEFLRANSSSYPLYQNPGSTSDTIHPTSNQFYTGWVMDDDRQNCSLENPSP